MNLHGHSRVKIGDLATSTIAIGGRGRKTLVNIGNIGNSFDIVRPHRCNLALCLRWIQPRTPALSTASAAYEHKRADIIGLYDTGQPEQTYLSAQAVAIWNQTGHQLAAGTTEVWLVAPAENSPPARIIAALKRRQIRASHMG